MATQPVTKLTEEEYLRMERAASVKSEFIGGQVFAMSGGSPRHSELAVTITAALHAQLRGRCRVYNSDLRIRTRSTGAYVYPDVSVVCGPLQLHPGSDDILINPKVIAEVLSPSTAAYDRGEKFDRYREILSLAEYILCHQDTPRMELFTRQADDTWIYRDVTGMDSTLNLISVDCQIRLAEIYQ